MSNHQIEILFQEEWLKEAAETFDTLAYSLLNDTAFNQQINASLAYAGNICPDLKDWCLVRVAMGQNLIEMLLKLEVQGKPVEGNVFEADAIYPEESGTSICVKISLADVGIRSKSGVRNGIETIIDLETFDNGDLAMTGDGAYIQVTEPHDYPLARLKGFSVGPGSAVEVHIRPSLFSITQRALDRFDYLERKCVETSIDKGLEDLDGMNGSYSLSNCLLSAALTQIENE